jgi:hypothetical protein
MEGIVKYYVWCPEQGAPTKAHATEAEAIKEAERLAHKHRGSKFIVLKSVGEAFVAPKPSAWYPHVTFAPSIFPGVELF